MSRSVQQSLPPMALQKVESTVSTVLKPIENWRALVPRAFGRAGWTQKRAALEMGIPEPQLSRQLGGVEHLSFWRMHALPREFWYELVILIIDFYELQIGVSEQDRRDMELGRTVREALQRSLAR